MFLVASILLGFPDLNPTVYFLLNLTLIALSAFAGATLAALMGLASDYPSFCITAISSGQGISGVIPAVLQLFFQTSHGKVEILSILATFSAGVMYSILSIAGYFYLKTPTNESVIAEDRVELLIDNIEVDEEPTTTTTIGKSQILDTIKLPFWSVLLNLLITMSIFPAITANIAPLQPMPNFVIYHFLCYNIADWIGKTVTVLPFFAISSPSLLFTLTCCRTLLIPAILSCNLILYDHNSLPYPQHIPVLFSDVTFLLLLTIFAFTNGIIG